MYFAFALVAVLACGCLWSCSDDGDGDDNNKGFSESNLIGEWISSSAVKYGISGGSLLYGSTNEYETDEYKFCFDDYGYGSFYNGIHDSFEWVYKDGSIRIFNCISGKLSGKWTVISLTPSTLVLEKITYDDYSDDEYDYLKITFDKLRDYDSGSGSDDRY